MSGELEAMLDSGLARLGADLGSDARKRLLEFVGLLARWNRVYNLTAVIDPQEMVARHILDSLTLLPYLAGPRVMDAGTGAGLPGIPLAIARPDLEFVLVDASGKRIRFIRHAVRTLGLANVVPVKSRLESLRLDQPPDDIVARALAPLPRMVDWLEPWISGSVRLLAMKAEPDEEELSGLDDAFRAEIVRLDPPGSTARRSVVIVTRDK